MGKGAKVACAVCFALANEFKAWDGGLQGSAKEVKALVVPKLDVVVGAVVFDVALFKKECFLVASCFIVIKVDD